MAEVHVSATRLKFRSKQSLTKISASCSSEDVPVVARASLGDITSL